MVILKVLCRNLGADFISQAFEIVWVENFDTKPGRVVLD